MTWRGSRKTPHLLGLLLGCDSVFVFQTLFYSRTLPINFSFLVRVQVAFPLVALSIVGILLAVLQSSPF